MTTAQHRQDDGASASQVAAVLGSVAPFTWQEAGRYLHMMADVASSLADRVNALVRRYPTASGGVLLGATIAGVAAWRRGRSAKPAARASARVAATSPSRTAKRRSTTATPRARGSKAAAAKSGTAGS